MSDRLFDDKIWGQAGSELGLRAWRTRDKRQLFSAPKTPVLFPSFSSPQAPDLSGGIAALHAQLEEEIPLGEATTSAWLAGRFQGREVLLSRGDISGIWIVAEIDPPLRLALDVRPTYRQDGPDRLGSLYEVAALDRERALRMFDSTPGGKALWELLCSNGNYFRAAPLSVWIQDAIVARSVELEPDSGESIVSLAMQTAFIAEKLEKAVGELLPAPWEEVAAKSLATVAEARGLTYDARRMSLTGEIDGCAVGVEVPVDAHGVRTVIWARFDAPLGLRFRLRKERAHPRVRSMLGLGDIATGDAAFDDAFFVGGKAARVRKKLSAEVRKLLLEAREGGAEVEANDRRVLMQLVGAPSDAAPIDRLVMLAARIARALSGPRAATSPYR